MAMFTQKNPENSPAVQHDHKKALHQYKRRLDKYEHIKAMLRKDDISA